ncbi:hypothetical protein A2U01_0093747, partial [Trifolium medium]|nr:hypothetical protein [Trifolium medium]
MEYSISLVLKSPLQFFLLDPLKKMVYLKNSQQSLGSSDSVCWYKNKMESLDSSLMMV